MLSCEIRIFRDGPRWHWQILNEDGSTRGSSAILGGYSSEAEAKKEGKAAEKRARFEIVTAGPLLGDEGSWAARELDAAGELVGESFHDDQHKAADSI